MSHTIESLLAMSLGTFQVEKAKGADTVMQFNVTGVHAGQRNVVIKEGKLNVAKGTQAAPELTITADTPTFWLSPTVNLTQPKPSCRPRRRSKAI